MEPVTKKQRTEQQLASRFACHGGAHLTQDAKTALEEVCTRLAQPGKGITAADESAGTIGKRVSFRDNSFRVAFPCADSLQPASSCHLSTLLFCRTCCHSLAVFCPFAHSLSLSLQFAAVGVENTEENRRKYRQMLFEAPGASDFLCGAILDPETLTQISSTQNK